MTYSRVGATNTVNSVTIVNSTINTGTLTGTTTVQGAAVFNNTATFNAAVSIPSTLSVTGTTTVGTLTGSGGLGPAISGQTVVSDSSSGTALRITQTGSGAALVVEDSANPDATPFVVDTNGRVGIGTSNPAYNLHIFSSNSQIAVIGEGPTAVTSRRHTTDSAGPYYLMLKARGTVASPTVVASGDVLGDIPFQGYDGANFQNAAMIRSFVDGTPGVTDMPGALGFFTTPDGSATLTERMRISSDGYVSIGIGTTRKANPVHIYAASTNSNTPTSANAILNVHDAGGAGGSGGMILLSGGNTDTGFAAIKGHYTDASNFSLGDLKFLTRNLSTDSFLTERMRITSTGNVGIGSINPSVARVHVAGIAQDPLMLERYDNSVNAGPVVFLRGSRGTAEGVYTALQNGDRLGAIFFQGAQGTGAAPVGNGAAIIAYVNGTVSGGGTNDMPAALSFFTAADGTATLTERMVINNAGNVGIGTSSASTRLSIAANSTSAGISIQAATADQFAGGIFVQKYRGTIASPTSVSAFDELGKVIFYGHDGTSIIPSSAIYAYVDGTPGTNDMPGRLAFFTTADGSPNITERMRIDNAGLITGSGPSLGAWTAYTPTLGGTGWALGNGTVSGEYVQIGKVIHFRGAVMFGSTSTFSATNDLTVTIPITRASKSASHCVNVRLSDASAGAEYVSTTLIGNAGTTFTVKAFVASTAGEQQPIRSTTPFTWATSDAIFFSGTYEAA